MKIKESADDQYGTFVTGLAYSGILAIILLLLCWLIDDNLFGYSLTFIAVALISIIFFISGIKRVEEKKLGFLSKLGKRHFDEYYSEGLWWIFPIWSFKQKLHFDILQEADTIHLNFVTKDQIPLEIEVKYFWQIKNPETIDNKGESSLIKEKLKYELGQYIKRGNALELLCDYEISNKVMSNYLIQAGETIGITITEVFPNINYESQYIPIVRSYQEKYKELQFQFDSVFKAQELEARNMKLYENQINNLITSMHLTIEEALACIKVYKNHVSMHENAYNIGSLNKVIDSVVSAFKK